VYFDQGSYQLGDDDRELLQQVSTFMRAHPEYRIKLIGHTDPEGDEQLNRYLSEFRAKVIANYLFWQGISDKRMTISGQGSRYPVGVGDDEADKAKNRRVFLKLEVANE
jgi:outer membrane protein OmpA-like peptidoglycan-associated protein